MAVPGKKLRSLQGGRVAFMCPGCKELHQVGIRIGPDTQGPAWGYNGNPDAPTFTPSILVNASRRLTDEEYQRVMAGETIRTERTVCHSFVTDGRIQFLGDCTHPLAGQTVDLPDIESEP